jgi:hypothetical protein
MTSDIDAIGGHVEGILDSAAPAPFVKDATDTTVVATFNKKSNDPRSLVMTSSCMSY